MRRTVFGAFVLIALAASIIVIRAQDYRRPTALPLQDVSGTWVLDDPQDSKEIVLPSHTVILIVQTGNMVRLETRGAKPMTLPMDGTETNFGPPGLERSRSGSARWVGNILMVTTKYEHVEPNNGESVALYALNVAGNLEVISQFNLTDGAAHGVSFLRHQYKRQ